MPAKLRTKKTRNSYALNSPVTRFKRLWPTLDECERDYWREQIFSRDHKQETVRQHIKAKLKIDLTYDTQLFRLGEWIHYQDKREAEAQRMREDEERFLKEFGTDNLDLVREKVLKRSYARTTAAEDIPLALATLRHDVSVKRVAIDERKLILLERKAAALEQATATLASKELSDEEKQQRMRELFGII